MTLNKFTYWLTGINYGAGIAMTIANPIIGGIFLGVLTIPVISYNVSNYYIDKENFEEYEKMRQKYKTNLIKKQFNPDAPIIECIICLKKITEQYIETTCGHSYHSFCIKTWCNMNPSCPVCRIHLI